MTSCNLCGLILIHAKDLTCLGDLPYMVCGLCKDKADNDPHFKAVISNLSEKEKEIK